MSDKAIFSGLIFVCAVVLMCPVSWGDSSAKDDLWEELVSRAEKVYRQAEKEREEGNLLRALTLMARASFMFPNDKRIKVKLDNILLELEEKIKTGEMCDQELLLQKLKEAQSELANLKQQMIEEKEKWQTYYQEKVKEIESAYEERLKVAKEKWDFDLHKKEQIYKELLEKKQEEYRQKLDEIKSELKENLLSLQEKIKEQDRLLSEKDEKIKKILASYTALEKKMEDRYQKTISSLTKRVKTLERENEGLKSSLSLAKRRLEQKEKEIRDVLDKYKTLSQDYKDLQTELEKTSNEGKRRHQECLSLLTDTKGRVKILEDKVKALQIEKENLSTKLSILEDKLAERKSMLSDLKKRLEERDIVIRNLKDKIATLKRERALALSAKKDSFSSKQAEELDGEEHIDAKEEAREDLDPDSLSTEVLLDEATKAINQEDYKLARDLLKKVLEKDPKNSVARYMLQSVEVILEE